MDEKILKEIGIVINRDRYPFPVLEIATPMAKAVLSLNGGHLLSYIPAGGRDLLWMSEKSYYETGKPLRGGVPVCWPWFGPVEGKPTHGFARTAMWQLHSAKKLTGNGVEVTLKLTNADAGVPADAFMFELFLRVTIGESLELQLSGCNLDTKPQLVSGALHTYFNVSEISDISVRGLDGEIFLDRAPDHNGEIHEQKGSLVIDREIDRLFAPSTKTVTIVDPGYERKIVVSKSGSRSTVVWNPWIAKAAKMADFGDEEYHTMLCVECANAIDDARLLEPGDFISMTQVIKAEK